MRIKNDIEKIDYERTKGFFDRRTKKYKDDNPYSTTMYQDDNPELVKERNEIEVRKLKPLLNISKETKILDIACGIGRWSDAIDEEIESYCGIDFCQGFIDLARERNEKFDNRFFYCASSYEIENCLEKYGKVNTVLLIGALMYLNDDELEATLEQVERLCENNSIICIREPIGIEERLTLKEQFSDELKDEYNAIYRTRNEMKDFLQSAFLDKGFSVIEEDFLFENSKLNNRKETAQYYYILVR